MGAALRILDWPADPDDDLPLALWDAVSIARATGGVAVGEFQVSGVEIDSRDVLPGDLFFALKGESMDGHRFVDAAFKKGASAVVVDRPVNGPHILVRDTFAALEALARAARAEGPPQGMRFCLDSEYTSDDFLVRGEGFDLEYPQLQSDDHTWCKRCAYGLLWEGDTSPERQQRAWEATL